MDFLNHLLFHQQLLKFLYEKIELLTLQKDIFGFLLEKHLKHITNNADYLEKIGQGMIDDFRKVILEQNQFVFSTLITQIGFFVSL